MSSNPRWLATTSNKLINTQHILAIETGGTRLVTARLVDGTVETLYSAATPEAAQKLFENLGDELQSTHVSELL